MNEAEGVWGHILSLVPAAEWPEIESLVGSSLIETNTSLWRELKAFNSILTELHTLEFDLPLYSEKQSHRDAFRDDGEAENSLPLSLTNLEEFNKRVNSSTSSSGSGSSVDAHPKIPALSLPPCSGANQQQQQQDHNASLTRRSNFSGDSMDFIFALEQHLCVDKIQPVLEDIRRALHSEQSELEAEISQLMSAMDGESDSVAARQAAASVQHLSSAAAAVATAAAGSSSTAPDPHWRGNNGDGDELVAGTGVCPSCTRVRDYAFQQPGRIRKAQASGKDGQLCFNCLEKQHTQHRKPSAGASLGVGTSRFRSKLQAARDEHHFLPDEF